MHPVLLDITLPWIGELRFHSYTFFLALGFLVSALLAAREGDRLPKPIYLPTQGAVWTLIGALIGSKVWWFLQYEEGWDKVLMLYRSVFIWEPGLVFYGGLAGGAIASIVYLWWTKTLDWRLADLCAPYLALGQAFGRMGCFLNSCCWGRVSDAPWAVVFPHDSHPYDQQVEDGLISSAAELPLPIHPTQLYEVLGTLCIFFFLRTRLKRSPFTFSVALGYFFLYGILRFTTESFRGDSGRALLDMTASQWVALGMVVFSALIYAGLERFRTRGSAGGEVNS